MRTPAIESATIIGGGIFGVSAATQLARMGISVTLVNDGELGGGASGRSLAWLNSARSRSAPYHHLRMAGIERYRSLALMHPNANWLRFDGGLTWDSDDDNNAIADMVRHERDIGYQAAHLSPEEVGRTMPGIRSGAITPQGAIFNPGEGWVDLPILIGMLKRELEGLGGQIVTDAGLGIPLLKSGIAIGVTCADGRTIRSDAVLLATGPSVPQMAADLGVIIGEETPISMLVETKPVDHPFRAVLNTPRVAARRTPTGAILMDSGWSERSVIVKDDGQWEAPSESVYGLLHELQQVLDPMPKLEVARVHMGPKPIPAGGEPVFGVLPGVPGCHVAFSHSGATLGLIAGELLADEMAFGLRHPLLAAFRPERYASTV